MAITLPQVLEQLRRDLGDLDVANAKWSSDELERHILRTLDEISRNIPRQVKTAATTTASRDFSIATYLDRIRIEAVEYPTGNWPLTFVRFTIYGDILTIHSDSVPKLGDAINIYWLANHTLTPDTSTLPQHIEHLVAIGAAGYAAIELAAQAANAVNIGGPQTSQRYLQLAQNKLADFNQQLHRFSDQGSLRTSKLYTPVEPLPSQSTDFGPGA